MAIPKTLKNILVLGVVVGLIAGSWTVWYIFYKPHRDVSTEKPKFELTSHALSESFKTDTAALGKYIDQALLVEGSITAVEGNHVLLGNIICSMDSANLAKASALKTGDIVKIQGRLTSYNDLMEEIVMDNCVFK